MRLLTAVSLVRVQQGELVLNNINIHGSMVKRLRHRPFTAVTRVRVPYGSPHGGIAQLVERSPHTREVTDSSSVVSTKILKPYGFRIFLSQPETGSEMNTGSRRGKEKPSNRSSRVSKSGGEGGIRTLETLLGPTRFPIVRARPNYATSPCLLYVS